MQFGEGLGYKMEADSWCEPLNLVKKKTKPVAVVAPSSKEGSNVEKRFCQPDSTQSSQDRNTPEYKNTNQRKPNGSVMLEALLKKNDMNRSNKNIFIPNNLNVNKDIFNQEKFADLFNNHELESKKQEDSDDHGFYKSYLNSERLRVAEESSKAANEKPVDLFDARKFASRVEDQAKLFQFFSSEQSKLIKDKTETQFRIYNDSEYRSKLPDVSNPYGNRNIENTKSSDDQSTYSSKQNPFDFFNNIKPSSKIPNSSKLFENINSQFSRTSDQESNTAPEQKPFELFNELKYSSNVPDRTKIYEYLNSSRGKPLNDDNKPPTLQKPFDFFNNMKNSTKTADTLKPSDYSESSKYPNETHTSERTPSDFFNNMKYPPKSYDPLRPDGLYSMINSLAACEQQFLAALYMNSLMSPNSAPMYPGANYFPGTGLSETTKNSAPVLSNLLSYADTQRRLYEMGCSWKDGRDPGSEPRNNGRVETETSSKDYECAKDLTIPVVPVREKLIPVKSRRSRKRQSSIDQKNSTNADNSKNQDQSAANNQDKKKPHIKKPLNAFMLYMKEMRAKVVAECTLKESAAINQILGRRWHALGREEQAKYYELARRERQLHMQLYPDWSSRANTTRGKKRKRKQDTSDGGNSMKKCRARYGLDQQSQWCKPCRRKKKCIRYMEAGDSVDGNQSDDNLGSCGSVGDAHTPPDDDAESLHRSISSPGGLSGLSSLTSPSMILPSPSTSLASPSVSLASPCMSLQSPLTPHPHHDVGLYDCKPPSMMPLPMPVPHRNPVGTNPHDINNPLSVNQLTGQCVKPEKDSRSVIGVT